VKHSCLRNEGKKVDEVFKLETQDLGVRFSNLESHLAAKYFVTALPQAPIRIHHVFHNISTGKESATVRIEGRGFTNHDQKAV
jgi:hypothetical protein